MKVALVHDYLREYGGAERVLEVLHEVYPEAPIYTAYYDHKGLGVHSDKFPKHLIKTSWIQNLPFANKLISPLRIFAPAAFESFDMTEYDLVISSSFTYFSKAVITKPEALHIAYIHTPPRYLYGYATSYNYKKHWWTRIGGEIANHFLRLWDFEVSQRPDILVANSENVRARIKKFYRRDSEVVYPPVEVEKLKSQIAKRKTTTQNSKLYYLSVGRLVRGKGIDVIIEACGKLGFPLKVVGSGPEEISEKAKVKSKKWENIEFVGHISDEKLPDIYAGAKATIVASEDEDFGIVPVESMSCGTPVLAVKAGGFLETVVPDKTGEFFDEATAESLTEALKKFDSEKYDPETCQKQAAKFSKEEFMKKIQDLVNKNLKAN
jgi:glycosyltransferase involved in cell wall biosynthesis